MLVTILAALVPLIMGFIWYNPKVLGSVWMKECGFKVEEMKIGFNPLKVFGLAILFSFMLSFYFNSVVIHQSGIISLLADKDRLTPEQLATLNTVKETAKGLYRTFKHGAFHGIIFSLFAVLPIFATNALFEKRSLKYVAIHVGYWMICLVIMGGILCQWSNVFDK